jgi:hypothetical protein
MNSILRAPLFPGLAVCIGWQEGFESPGFWVYNLLRDVPGHPFMSTVTEQTLRDVK